MAASLFISWWHSSVLAASCWWSIVTALSCGEELVTVTGAALSATSVLLDSRTFCHSCCLYFWPTKNCSYGWSPGFASVLDIALQQAKSNKIKWLTFAINLAINHAINNNTSELHTVTVKLGPVLTSHFTCAKSNAELSACKMRHLNQLNASSVEYSSYAR